MISKSHFINGRKDCFCQTPELIENYEQAINDKTQVWECHHRDEIRTLPSGMVVIRTREELKENGRYYNCPPNELIFLTKEEHTRIHSKTREFSEEHRTKISKALKGITRTITEEHRRKISKANKGKSKVMTEEHRRKISEGKRGKIKSEFGIKFKEHFGITNLENPKLYKNEYKWYFRHNKKCRWEEE